MTPDFRERLFQLTPDELGLYKDENGEITYGSKMKARIIPIQLQRLFAQLLLLNAESVSTDELTASFGWTNNEERDQQDVQELNRILFRFAVLTSEWV
jgi:ubiquitin carboxyl-terminal hydrolase 40